MKKDIKNKFDLSIPRRHYYSKDYGLANCPECGLPLVENNCTVMLSAKSDIDEGGFMTNMTGSHFCDLCPVVVLDSQQLEKALELNLKGINAYYSVPGIVNMDAIPKEKNNHTLGTDENPIPLVEFLPNMSERFKSHKKVGRNEPCPCGSGKKHKKCCG
jgi:hypothetical protein